MRQFLNFHFWSLENEESVGIPFREMLTESCHTWPHFLAGELGPEESGDLLFPPLIPLLSL